MSTTGTARTRAAEYLNIMFLPGSEEVVIFTCAFIGAMIGVLFGLTLSLVQQHYGLLRMGANFIVEYYPVKVVWSDIFIVIAVVVLVGVLIAWYPVKYINSRVINIDK